jgi:hypothetical protein
MAFKNSSNTGRTQQQQGDNENWKATAFLNVYVNTGNGNKRKVTGIPLKESRAFEAALIERLKEEGGLEAFAENVTFTFEMADKEVKSSDLGW